MRIRSTSIAAVAWSLALLPSCTRDPVEPATLTQTPDAAVPDRGPDGGLDGSPDATPDGGLDGSPDGGPMDDVAACIAGYECVMGCPTQECESACFAAVTFEVSALLAEALVCTGNAGCNVRPTLDFDCARECRDQAEPCLGQLPRPDGDDDCAALYACSLGCGGFDFACLSSCWEGASADAATTFAVLQSCAAGEAQCEMNDDVCLSSRCPEPLVACPFPQ